MKALMFLSHVLDEQTPTYGGKGKISILKTRQMSKGDPCNEMAWAFSDHAGTHVDAPKHFIQKGKTIDQFLPEDWLFNTVELVVLNGVKAGQIIGPDDMPSLNKGTECVLIKTGYERFRKTQAYWDNAPGLHPDLAVWLKRSCPKIRAVGMDLISISSIGNRELGRASHREFLGREILLIEDMKLSVLKKSPHKVWVAPIRVKDADAAPCSIFAWSV
ncbi:MAG: cyclase family protein [Candidatus Omnitrophica bacterium]|nr:cyclase family protein [Candidatus Omnitrophota bacterium]